MKKQRTAVVTGSNSGIGLGIAHALAAEGHNVVINSYTDTAEDHALADEIAKKHGNRTAYIQANLFDGDDARALVHKAAEAFGSVDILVNNAGIQHVAPIEDFPVDMWNRIIALNMSAAFHTSAVAVPLMREAGWGRIVNQLSSGAFPAQSVYGVSKLALLGVTTTLAQEAGRSGITVNAIAPGVTDSGAGLTLRENPSEYSKMWEMMCPLSYRGQPDQLTGAMLYLCSEAGSWTTGQVIHVDGGAVMIP